MLNQNLWYRRWNTYVFCLSIIHDVLENSMTALFSQKQWLKYNVCNFLNVTELINIVSL